MDFPFLLLTLLVLPVAVAGVIVGSSSVRRRRRTAGKGGSLPQPRHRFQAETASVQAAAVHPEAPAPKVAGRERRRASAVTPRWR